jgi:hypothetical protein
MMDPESSVAVGTTPRYTKMALFDDFLEEAMSGYEALRGRSVAASKSQTKGKQMHSSSIKTRSPSKADASFHVETRQTIEETARRGNESSPGLQDIACTGLARVLVSQHSLSGIFSQPSVTEDTNGGLVALQLRSSVSTDCGDGEHKSSTSQRDIQSATRPSITFTSNKQIPTYWTANKVTDIGHTRNEGSVEKAKPESDRYEVERVVGHDRCKG